MSKRFKGLTCAYCATEGASTTGDHVFAREFFPLNKRGNLPKVAACEACNNGKSKLEHYLTAVLPFGGKHPDASHMLNSMVPPRLAKNVKLHNALSEGQSRAWINRGGFIRPTMTIPIDADQFRQLFTLIMKGLMTHHWGVHVPPTHNANAGLLTEAGEALLAPMLAKNGRARAKASVGGGAFEYNGLQAVDDPLLSIWCFRAYGGITLGGDSRENAEATPRIWAMTSRQPLLDIFDE